MRSGIRNLLWACFVILAFLGGVTAGVYYYQEIMVWVRATWPGPAPDVAGIATPAPVAEHNSHLTLPGVEGNLPLVFSDTLEEAQVQEYLKEGAVVLPLGTNFGDTGNVVVTAHSSGTEAFGPYRFAFAKLSELTEGQEYSVTTPTAVYTYRVYGKEIVWPHEVDKLPQDDRSTVTLVTCWPLWTNFKRLLVHTELVNTEYRL
ncbi:MAG: sortase [Candidatus Andersenbacteria bacterium]